MIKQTSIKDLPTIVTMYTEVNPSCDYDDIYNWTKRGIDEFPKFNLIYETNNSIIGSISGVVKENNIGVINDIVVNQSWRKQKIGSQLLDELLKIFQKNSINKIRLCVGWKNASAIPFYYKHGFTMSEIGNLDNEDVIFLEKLITD